MDYHRQFYRAENLVLVITGNIDEQKIFSAIERIEKKIGARASSLPPFLIPWQDPVPALMSSLVVDVPYPCDDEDNGLVNVGWRGPSAKTQIYTMFATICLMEYLTGVV